MYRFNLQAVLNYRKRIEEGLQMEVSRRQRELESAKQVFFAYQREKGYYEEELAQREAREVKIDESILYRDYLKGMNRKIKEQREIVAKAKIGVDEKQEELLIATKKRKVLEKVREKHMKEFMDSLERKERIFTDEINVQRYQKRGSSLRLTLIERRSQETEQNSLQLTVHSRQKKTGVKFLLKEFT